MVWKLSSCRWNPAVLIVAITKLMTNVLLEVVYLTAVNSEWQKAEICCLPRSSNGIPSCAAVKMNSSLQDSSSRIAWSRNVSCRNVGTLFAHRTHSNSSRADPSWRPVIEYFIYHLSLMTNQSSTIQLTSTFIQHLTLSPPIPLRLYSLPYWCNAPYLIFDIRVLWRSGMSARAPECQKLKMVR